MQKGQASRALPLFAPQELGWAIPVSSHVPGADLFQQVGNSVKRSGVASVCRPSAVPRWQLAVWRSLLPGAISALRSVRKSWGTGTDGDYPFGWVILGVAIRNLQRCRKAFADGNGNGRPHLTRADHSPPPCLARGGGKVPGTWFVECNRRTAAYCAGSTRYRLLSLFCPLFLFFCFFLFLAHKTPTDFSKPTRLKDYTMLLTNKSVVSLQH